MASIISETFSDGADKALQLENEEFGRLLAIGSDWTYLRIGVMYNIVPDGTNNIATADIRLGGSNGADKHIGSGTDKLWYGNHLGANSGTAITGGTWTHNAGSGDPYFVSSGNTRIRQAGTTLSGAGNSSSHRHFTSDGATRRRGVLITNLEKNGTSMWVGGQCNNNVSSPFNADFTLAEFREAMATFTAPPSGGNVSLTVGGKQLSGLGTTQFTGHDTNAATYGDINSAHIGWNKGLINFLNIFAIEVYRHA